MEIFLNLTILKIFSKQKCYTILFSFFSRILSHTLCGLKRTLFPASISTKDQYCSNVVDQRWNNVNPTLKMKQNPTSDF